MDIKAADIDHDPAKTNFKQCQANLVKLINENEAILKELLIEEEDFDKFFIKIPEEDGLYYGTRYFYELGYNNVCALGMLCHVCNQAKSDRGIMDWMEVLELKDEFVAYLGDQGISIPEEKDEEEEEIEDLEALNTTIAQAARAWLKERSENIMLVYKGVEEFSGRLREIIEKENESDPEKAKLVGEAVVGAGDNIIAEISSMTKRMKKGGVVKAAALEEEIGNLPEVAAAVTGSKALQDFTLEAKKAAMEHLSEKKIDIGRAEAAFAAVLEVAQAIITPSMKAVAPMVRDDQVPNDQFRINLAPLKKHVEELTLESVKKDNESRLSLT